MVFSRPVDSSEPCSLPLRPTNCLDGGALQAGCVHIRMFLAMKAFIGLGTGMIIGSVPLYQ
ncbi:uncharacterized protein ASPGLDRAFT_49710 [Aspergillus glaucus CBS 516.65]|uniref:Uncharacterized protein n=1 Tax=Aspergillus glaucus CBS 516.65 TaxID=1160497 RepID=A0A1L9VCW0_ASPGL|nr:hypothetical protein ASPGLDRAFT_49710 [Aspergillus glaucus CBS 516.65]OJJ81749.1 hypothetical protein ASPGLDRAFT_49710 [Aspergillus glaucus CBS 516.65]